MNRATVAFSVFFLSSPAVSQLAINEVLIDPVGPNAGNQIVELINTSSMPFDPTGWSFCVRPDYPPMPSITIPAGGIVRVHFAQSGANTTTDWFLPPNLFFTFTEFASDDELALYSSTFNFTSAFLEDFVSWGNGRMPAFNSRLTEAGMAGEWPGPVHVPVPPEGSTIAWFGSGNGPSAWFADSTPTLGSPNRPASVQAFGTGCAGSAGVPGLALNSLPWLGQSYAIDLTSVPGPTGLAIMITSFTETPPQNLAAFGMPGCNGYVTPTLTTLVFTNGGSGVFGFPLPATPSFEGTVFLNQALVVDPAAGNTLGAVMSNPVRTTIGQR